MTALIDSARHGSADRTCGPRRAYTLNAGQQSRNHSPGARHGSCARRGSASPTEVDSCCVTVEACNGGPGAGVVAEQPNVVDMPAYVLRFSRFHYGFRG
ncbi:hypothetical protein Daura_30300 [Dactylosporangium aurantiacum]|uniref:Uncharacterized protein n=1 Tax=Dactylosporangium aurantiacum TaxID=35754 RepID=A0A9Q9ME68_9ACTN|nr:hypothetical protein [Dactylosporangium aurantiacum]UWZ51055.1 hypothetical protein Daura_30300 [Dactylosporangium aurantiacum]